MKRMYIPVSEAFAEWRKDPEFIAAYDALEEEFALAAARIEAEKKQEKEAKALIPTTLSS